MKVEMERGKIFSPKCSGKINHSLNFRLCLYNTDGHSTVDIIFKWVPGDTEVSIGNKELAQFEYKGSALTSGVDEFGAVGKEIFIGTLFTSLCLILRSDPDEALNSMLRAAKIEPHCIYWVLSACQNRLHLEFTSSST